VNAGTWTRRLRLVLTLLVLGLVLGAVGVLLPLVVMLEPATPMPYSWPAHHALFLHTDGEAAECTVDDGVTEPFTVVLRAPGTAS
jgi:hypothetical protein